MSAVEAMAAGLPVLVSDGVPVGQWAQKVGAGLVVPCTKASFQQAALELLSRPDELVLMGKRGRELAQERFDISVVTRQMLAQFESIVATGHPVQDAI
jgi:glycosyltransferase involved in cell wall biosynthesis